MGIGGHDNDDVVVKGDDGTKTGKKVKAFDDCKGNPALNVGSSPGAGIEIREVEGSTIQYQASLAATTSIQLPAVEDKFITDFIVNNRAVSNKDLDVLIGSSTVPWTLPPGDYKAWSPKDVKSITLDNTSNQAVEYQVTINYRDCS
jgi:hypothetical protein